MNKSEVVPTFSHVYTEHNFSMKNGAMTDISAQIADQISSVLLTREGAVALARTFNRLARDMGADVG